MSDSPSAAASPLQKAYSLIQLLRKELELTKTLSAEPIAVVGMACRAPSVNNPEELWQLVRAGRDAITDIPKTRWDAQDYYDPRPGTPGKAYTLRGGFVEHADKFDASFFGISAREAEGMDPQQRLLLEVAWEALEHAGIPPSSLIASASGVFVGVTSSDYGLLQACSDAGGDGNPYFNTGTPLNACAGRISYVLGLQGPCMAVDTACSSSLTAIHLACTSLRAKDCDLALTGGVNLTLSPLLNVTLSAAGMMSADGKCKTFSEDANGYVRGEGCGIVVLKRLSDAIANKDNIIGVIRATGVNQDGASSGFTVPNGQAQQKLIRQTLLKSGLQPHDIDYVEAHGTGTPLGDPIEAQSLGAVIGQAEQRDRPLLVGSIKSNIGHLESAAGVMGLIKLLKALEHRELPPTLHIQKPSSRIPWSELNLQPVYELQAWRPQGTLRRAGLSAFGASGSNAHLIIEEAAAPAEAVSPTGDGRLSILALSAKSKDGLAQTVNAYSQFLAASEASLNALCLSSNRHRDHFKHRVAFTARSKEQAIELLNQYSADKTSLDIHTTRAEIKKAPRVAFVFGGQGSIYSGMSKELYQQQPSFAKALDECCNILDGILDTSLLQLMHSADEEASRLLNARARYAQPALFSVQYALSKMWMALGVTPCAVAGHSLGEYAAACVAGVMSLKDALHIVAERGRLTDTLDNHGSMLVVFSTLENIAPLVQAHAARVSVAVINSENSIVLSGDKTELQAISAQLQELKIETHPLAVTHAFHSPLMDPILAELETFAKGLTYSEPALAFFSSLTGKMLDARTNISSSYWRRHYREPVLFATALESLASAKPDLVIEIGPNAMLANLGQSQLKVMAWLPSLQRYKSDEVVVAHTIAKLYSLGFPIDWTHWNFGSNQRVPNLPTYQFQRQRYWIHIKEQQVMNAPTSPGLQQPAQVVDHYDAILNRLLQLFAELFRVSAQEIDIHSPFVEMGADSLVLLSGARVIEDNFGVKIEIRQFFEEISSVSAIAHYLNSLQATQTAPAAAVAPAPATSMGVSPPPAAAIAQQVVAPSAVASTPVAAPLAHAPAMAAMPMPAPINFSQQEGSALSQLILAQTQLMSQHLSLMHAAASGQAVAQTIAQPATFVQPSAPVQAQALTSTKPVTNHVAVPPQPVATPSASAPPKSEDRSSPLKALNIPITPTVGNLTTQQSTYLNELIDRYQRKTPKSKALVQASRKGLADSRASIGFRFSTKEILYPITGVDSTGSRIWDVDGNNYVDLTMGFGVLLFGSKPEFLEGVIQKELEHGFQLGPRSIHMGEITELFTEITGHDRVAFTNSGTEAVMIAMRLARAKTGRNKIVIFDGAYNGHSDGTLVKTSIINGEFVSEPLAPGVPENIAKDVLVLEYGAQKSLDIIREQAHELAAVLVEPVQSRRLDLQPFEFLKELRALTQEKDVALIFDEMVSGFRAHPAGVQGLLGIRADLATYGKIIGGGLPIGAVAGSNRFMGGIDGGYWEYGDASYPRETRTYFGGTFCQHPLSMATCLVTLRKLKAEGPALQEKLNRRTAALASTLNQFFEAENVPIKVVHFASTFQFKFSGNLEMFYYQLLEKGVYIWEWRACFLSTAHTDQDLDDVVKAVKETVFALRDGGYIKHAAPTSTLSAVKALETNATQKEAPSERAWFRQQSKLSHSGSLSDLNIAAGGSAKHLDFSVFYFGNYDANNAAGKYQLLMDGAQYADAHGFSTVWIPERHFDEFGGFSPNPAVLAAAVARETTRIQICAGSVVAPLHDPIRIVEEWSLVDNLSDGRVGISFASGWHPNDFVFAPDSFSENRNVMFESIKTVKHLWSGGSISRKGGNNSDVVLRTFPRPKQEQVPIWLTVVNNPDSYQKAGELGLNILTNLMGQSLEDLANNIRLYRQAYAAHGHDLSQARITVLIHTYLEDNAEQAIEEARKPMCDYLLSSIHLFQKMASGLGPVQDINRASKEDKDFIVNKAYEKYVATSALIGSAATVEPIVDVMLQMGVTELACFIDFGVNAQKVLDSLPHINKLKDVYQARLLKARNTFPLGEAQKQLWLIAQLNQEGNLAYNDPGAVSLQGPLDTNLLSDAVQAVIHRHESLRTWLDAEGNEQHVMAPEELHLDLIDLSAHTDPSSALSDWFLLQANTPFQLNNAALFKPSLLKLATEHHVLALSSHHIISDGPSMGVVLHEIIQNYALMKKGLPLVAKPALQYRDFLQWQTNLETDAVTQAHQAYWLKQFSTPVTDLTLPYDFPRPQVKTYQGARAWAHIDPTLLKAVRELAGKNASTLYMVLFAAFSVLMHRLSEQKRIAIGAPYTGRSMSGSESLVGYCVHLLPIVSVLTHSDTFAAHLQTIKQQLLQAYEHQDYPFARLLNQLNLPRDISRSPLINVIFNLERLNEAQVIDGLTVDMQQQPIAYTRMDLTFTANLKRDHVVLECDYNTNLFEASTIESLLKSYLSILETVVKDPQISNANIALINQHDSKIQLTQWNAAQRKPTLSSFIEVWNQSVAKHPDTVALVSLVSGNEVTLTYAELNAQANQLAHHLLSLGLKNDQRTGICLTRSWQMIVAMLACLKAGGAYVPLDPSYPKNRLTYILEDAKIELLITEQTIFESLSFPAAKSCCLDKELDAIQLKARTNPVVNINAHNLAYVIYTSGSTGQPKGAMITHEGFINYLSWAKDAYHAEQADGSPVLGSFSFDATITSIFVPFMAGNKIVLMPNGDELQALNSLNRSPYQFSFIKITPAHLEILNSLQETDKFSNTSLTHALVLGGEALQASSVNSWLSSGQVSIVNEYGPTETVVGCCVFETKDSVNGLVPIGKPIEGMRMYVLDANLQLLPAGIAGDLYIGGLGLARGYLARPANTAASFIPDPFCQEEDNPGARLYKTGDRARYLSNGDLVFLGRKDHQIKLNGYRIELGEIEVALAQVAGVKEAAVMLREDRPGVIRLVAYYSCQRGENLKAQQLRDALKVQLPEYMVPTAFVPVSEMPLSSHGKVDVKALPAPGHEQPDTATNQTPQGELEIAIAKVWCEVLGCAHVNPTDNFFDLGGNSLLILQAFKKLEALLPADCQVIDLFKYPTIHALAEFASKDSASATLVSEQITDRIAKQKMATLKKADRRKASLSKTPSNKPVNV